MIAAAAATREGNGTPLQYSCLENPIPSKIEKNVTNLNIEIY